MLGTVSQEFWRGARVRQQTTGTDVFTALVGLVGRNKRRYGGYVVHVGIVLMVLGFAGEAFKQSEQLLLKPGQTVKAGDVTARLDALRVTDDGQKQMVTAHLTVTKDGQEVGKMYPARWFFRKHEDMPTTEVAIRRSFSEDIYLVLAAFEPGEQSATVELVVNPLVNWLWFGFGVVGLGTLIALLPEATFAFAAANAPSRRRAGDDRRAHPADAPGRAPGAHWRRSRVFTALERAVRADIKCTCGCRRSLALCGMPNCHGEAEQMARDAQVHRAGPEPPAGAGVVRVRAGTRGADGAAERGLQPHRADLPDRRRRWRAWRWSASPRSDGRGGGRADAGPEAPIDPTLDARLDDELRDLD